MKPKSLAVRRHDWAEIFDGRGSVQLIHWGHEMKKGSPQIGLPMELSLMSPKVRNQILASTLGLRQPPAAR